MTSSKRRDRELKKYMYICYFYFLFCSVLVKFYVIDKFSTIINSSLIYESLTDGGQDFYLGDYKVTRVEESGKDLLILLKIINLYNIQYEGIFLN